jgi:hypothetical protein
MIFSLHTQGKHQSYKEVSTTTIVIIIVVIIHAVVIMMDFDSHQDNVFKASNKTDNSFILNSTDCVSKPRLWVVCEENYGKK